MFILGNAKKNMLSTPEQENKYYNENYEIDLNNDNNSHSIIVNNAKESKNILDVGCGVGYIGRKLIELSKCKVDGIEIDKESFKIVSKIYNKTFSFSIEDYDNPEYKSFIENKDKYDCIILADVIEHLVDPGKTIYTLSKKLTDKGMFIISTPNIAHIDVVSNLINGKFNYNKTGILDSTHVKLFTESSFYDFVDNINKKYKLSFGVKTIGKTYAKKDDKNDKFLLETKGMEVYVYQNIFLLSKDIKTVNIKNKDYYALLNDNYLKGIELEKNNAELNKKINELEYKIETLNHKLKEENQKNKILKNENKEYKKVNEELTKELDKTRIDREQILNSKSWKITKPLRKVSSVIHREKGTK